MFDSSMVLHNTLLLPFPYNRQTYCRYEPIEKKIDAVKVLIVNDLLRYESDLSELGRNEWGDDIEKNLRLENTLAQMACDNIANNVHRLVKQPHTLTVHLSELSEAAETFCPEAIVMSGTLSDFDRYDPAFFESFKSFITKTTIPVLGICGAHQMIAFAHGSEVRTLDGLQPSEKRTQRVAEFQYRYVKITDVSDPIFHGIEDHKSGIWQEYTLEGQLLRVWQNHGLQVIGIPKGFTQLAKSYLCNNQMMVRRNGGQLIYSVQFHLEKSFEDWSKNPTRWEHPNESRDGRILFENFLQLALEHRQTVSSI